LTDHPTPAELEGLVYNRISPERVRSVIAHLLLGCKSCRAAIAPFLAGLFGTPGTPDEAPLTLEQEAAYDAALDRALGSVIRTGEGAKTREVREALRLLAENGIPAPSSPEEASLVEALLERSWALRYENPEQMVRLARMASRLAATLPDGKPGDRRAADLRFRALTELGNACRVADDLDAAKEVLDEAVTYTLEEGVDERLTARYFDVLASLYGARRHFEMAASALAIAHSAYRRLGDEHLAGRALISLGIYTGYEGDAPEAIRLIGEGLASVDEERDPDLIVLALHNQARLLVDCGQYREARRVLWDLERREIPVRGRVNELKVRWLEAQISSGLEDLDHAERTLLAVKDGFATAHLPYKAALAGLELGAVRLRQGRIQDSERVVLEAIGVFIHLRIRREALAAVLLLKKACESRVATVALIESVAGFLRCAEDDPLLRFEACSSSDTGDPA
jgi:tetratricopeptide (TPR) repeat protein